MMKDFVFKGVLTAGSSEDRAVGQSHDPSDVQLKYWPDLTVRREISLLSAKLTTTRTCRYYFVTSLHFENSFDKQISRLHSVTFKWQKNKCKQTW